MSKSAVSTTATPSTKRPTTMTPRALIQTIVEELVDSPSQVKVEAIEGETATIVEVRVAHDDLGKVIGKKGKIVQSLRTILYSVSAKIERRHSLEIIE